MITLNALNTDQLYALRRRVTLKHPPMARAHGWDWHASRLRLIEGRIDMAKIQHEKRIRGIV
jgi:hypothetical protein